MPTNFQNLRIGHLNVRGLERHIDGVKIILDKKQYHIFAVTETKLKSTSPIGPIRIPGYDFIRHSLPSSRGRGTNACGGIGFYVQKGIKATPLVKSSFDPATPLNLRVEFMAILMKINDWDCCVAALYNPLGTNPNFAQNYEKLLLDVLDVGFDRLFVVGDFNVNIAASQPSTNLAALRRINSAFNLTVLPTGPTRITEQSATTIDLLITDSPEIIIKSQACTGNTVSDHEIVYLLANVRVLKSPPVTLRVRNFKAIDQARLHVDFQALDHRPFIEADEATTKAELLTINLRDLMNQHAPERTIVVRDKRTPWITHAIKEAVAERDLAYALYSRNPNRARGDDQWLNYERKRDRAKSLVYVAKKRYAEQHFDHNLPAKKLWSNLRREGIHNNAKKNDPAGDVDADELNAFFSSGHRQLQAVDRSDNSSEPCHRTTADHGDNGFAFRHTDVNEISRKILEVQTNATGTDDIPISFVKLLCPFVLPMLAHLFNHIIDTSSFPAAWKKAIVTPIPKSSSPIQPKDFRPISVLPAVSKVLEKVLLGQISEHLNAAEPPLLAQNQSGYRKGYSTTTALTKVVHDVYSNLDENRCTVMVLVDFSLAFNCVNHQILRKKLNTEFKFTRSACDLITSFLSGRSQIVRFGNSMSAALDVPDGTPQGSCLSALLFSLYINSLPRNLKCEWQLYADDLQVYLSGPIAEVDRIVRDVNEDLAAIADWARVNQLFPNPKKTQAIVFNKTGTVTPQENIVFCDSIIPLSSQVINLGLHMDCNLTWKAQVNDVVRKVYHTLRTFRRFGSVLSLQTRRKLVQAVIVPFFTYCDTVYFPGLSAALREQLHRGFKSALRFVHNLRRRDTTVALRNSIMGHDLPDNYQLRVCCFMKKAFEGTLPDYIMQHLQRGRQERTAGFIIPRHTTSSGKSVLVHGASCWNSLPMAIKREARFNPFKRAVITHMQN